MSPENDAAEEQLAPYKIEPARSSRSKCKTCRRAIDKDTLRLGILIEGPFGQGYLWHHLKCAARRQIDAVKEAYEQECWEKGVEVPPLPELEALAEAADKERAEKKQAPWVERAPSGRSKCAHCNELVLQGAWRVIVLRSVEFYNQVRSGPIKVHPGCVAAALDAADSATEKDGFADAVRANSGLPDAEVDAALAEIGEI
jgi:hypothetical protein